METTPSFAFPVPRLSSMRWFSPPLYCAGLVLFITTSSQAAPPPGVQFFEQKIRPILVKHCYECHSVEANKVRGGLLLDTRAGLLKGGESGPALIPGRPV